MAISNPDRDSEIDTGLAADAQIVARMRLVLSISAFLAVYVDPSDLRGSGNSERVVFSGYILHSLLIYVYSQLDKSFFQRRIIHWIDVFWYTLIILVTDGVHGFFFLFYFFAILTSSFRWGFDEGARVTIASVTLYAACGLDSMVGNDLPRLLLRIAILLALGYMIVHWGGSKVEMRRRLALLRNVSHLSNPRFGVGHTITSVMGKTREFFGGASCILLMREKESGTCSLRTHKEGDAAILIHPERIQAEAVAPLLAFAKHHVVVFSRPLWPGMASAAGTSTFHPKDGRWRRRDGQDGEILAEFLDARSFISAPLSLRMGDGRIYIVSRKGTFRKSDALFLSHIVAQVFPVIENIEVLDKIASDAASKERQRIALDLHDTAIQPYIGLRMGLSALRKKSAADNPLTEDLDRLVEMADKVIGELRRYAGAVKSESPKTEQVLLMVLRQQAAQVRDFYGIDIAVRVEGEIQVDDRLTAEVSQLVREGLSNICKHTHAQTGVVRLGCQHGRLRIQIENEAAATPFVHFLPRSIAERAAALGGSAQVRQQAAGNTAVLIDIPI